MRVIQSASPRVEGTRRSVLQQLLRQRGMLHAVVRNRGTGIGLNNVRERLQHLYGSAGTLQLEEMSSGGTRVILILPQLAEVHS